MTEERGYIHQYEPLFGGWTADGYLGSGSFGRVWRVRRESSGHTEYAAVKEMVVGCDTDEARLHAEGLDAAGGAFYYRHVMEKTLGEITLMQDLHGCAHIVAFHESAVEKIDTEDEHGWVIFILMELLTPLRTRLEEAALTLPEIIRIGRDLCAALETCEAHGILHRDIKPDNIYFDPGTGRYKLGDFGISHYITRPTAGKGRPGTLTYMSPEVFQGADYTPASDLYSLGMILYRMMNKNRIPFLVPWPDYYTPVQRDDALVRRLRGEDPPPPSPGNASEAPPGNMPDHTPAYNISGNATVSPPGNMPDHTPTYNISGNATVSPPEHEPCGMPVHSFPGDAPVRGMLFTQPGEKELTDALCRIAHKCIRAQQQDRFRSAAALRTALESLSDPEASDAFSLFCINRQFHALKEMLPCSADNEKINYIGINLRTDGSRREVLFKSYLYPVPPDQIRNAPEKWYRGSPCIRGVERVYHTSARPDEDRYNLQLKNRRNVPLQNLLARLETFAPSLALHADTIRRLSNMRVTDAPDYDLAALVFIGLIEHGGKPAQVKLYFNNHFAPDPEHMAQNAVYDDAFYLGCLRSLQDPVLQMLTDIAEELLQACGGHLWLTGLDLNGKDSRYKIYIRFPTAFYEKAASVLRHYERFAPLADGLRQTAHWEGQYPDRYFLEGAALGLGAGQTATVQLYYRHND